MLLLKQQWQTSKDDALLTLNIINRDVLNKDTSTLESCPLLKIRTTVDQARTVHFVFLGLLDLHLPNNFIREETQNISSL